MDIENYNVYLFVYLSFGNSWLGVKPHSLLMILNMKIRRLWKFIILGGVASKDRGKGSG